MKKKVMFFVMLLFASIMLTSCDIKTFLDSLRSSNESEEIEDIESIPSVENSVVASQEIGDLVLKQIDFNNSLDADGPMLKHTLPSVGKPNILVIPINLNATAIENSKISDIYYAFNGTSDETGWESVKTYYQKSSYNQLDLQIDVINEWYTPKNEISYYEKYNNEYNEEGSHQLLNEAIEFYDNVIDYSKYDSDNDGSIDAVWVIYNHKIDYDNNGFYWAYASTNPNSKKYDGVKAYRFAFAGFDFIHPNDIEAGSYNPSGINYDAHVFIHETGHMFGLDDYYDYNPSVGASGGCYGADMMDYNVGDHSPISKLLLGWVDPIVVSGSGTASFGLTSFAETGKFLLISDHEIESIYDEYFLIEFYNNDGLNKRDNLVPNAHGIRVMHIDARKNIVDGTVKYNSGSYRTGFMYDNSDEEYLFCNTLRADIGNDGVLKRYSLYGIMNSFSNDYGNYKMHSGSNIPFSFKVVNINETQIDITLSLG